jgi:hypothetical protein
MMTPRSPRRMFALLVACAGVAIAAASCLGPTEILVVVRTNAPCTDPTQWRGVAIYAGQPGDDVESRAPAIVTGACDGSGNVGSVMLVPTGARDDEVGVRVVAGLTRDPEQCSQNGYQGCIVARRTLRYLPHESPTLVIDLTVDCKNIGCDAIHTCFAGSCTSATQQAGSDGDAAAPPQVESVRCGDDGLRCPLGDPSHICCVTFDRDAGTGQGACVLARDCPSTSTLYNCDKPSDCVGAGSASDPGVCCESVDFGVSAVYVSSASCMSLSACYAGANQSALSVVCGDRQNCTMIDGGPGICFADPSSPGYFICKID